MEPTFKTPPRTIMEVYQNLPEGTLAELIDDVIYMSPSPVKNHQKVLQTIFRRLSENIEDLKKGEVIVAPFDVYLDITSNAVQPDIIVILDGNPGHSLPDGHFHGVPDIIVEVLSPGNRDYDFIKKKQLYERFGVKEYWIVDPDTKDTWCYALENAHYIEMSRDKNKIHFKLLDFTTLF
jgi:Uma2 family endonuclease